MANYRIIGADLLEYGPVNAEQIRQWIIERRVDAETKLQVEGSTEWKRLADVPEFAGASLGKSLSTCPTCGEAFEEGFDSCWKCGTGRDGTPPKEAMPAEVDRWAESVEPCPKCRGSNVRHGKLLADGEGGLVTFRPTGTRLFTLSFLGGVALSSNHSLACWDCGLVWNYVRPDELKEFIFKHCK